MKEGNAMCLSSGKSQKSDLEMRNQESKDDTPIKQLEEKLKVLTNALSQEKDLKKQQEMLKSINLLIETIKKLKD